MPTIPEEIAPQVSAVQAILERQLKESLQAIYLFGSAVQGGLKPHSDIDLMVVVATPIQEAIRRSLMRELLSHSAWPGSSKTHRALEVTIVARSKLLPWRYPPRREMQFGEWLRQDIEAGRFEPPMPDADLAILITKLRRHGVAIYGPHSNLLFEDVPPIDLKKSLAEAIAQWNAPSDWHGDERNVILALARIWYTACTGEIAAKDQAAIWAAERLPDEHRWLMEQAVEAYIGAVDGSVTNLSERVARLIGFCKSEIERCLNRPD